MELPSDIAIEISKYTQPTLRNKLGITAKNIIKSSPEDRVHSYNLSTLSGMDLLTYIWDNSLDDEFNNRDWSTMLNELPLFDEPQPNSVTLTFLNGDHIYITDGQKNIIENLISNYYDLLYNFYEINQLYLIIGLYDLLPEDQIFLDDDYDHYLIGKLIYDDTNRDINLNIGTYNIIHYGLYNYGIANGNIFTNKDIQNIIRNMYYTPEKEELLRKLLDILKGDENVDIMLSHWNITHPVHNQKMKIVCDALLETHYDDVIENYIDLYIDNFLEEGRTSSNKAYKFICRIKDIDMYKKIKRFFINIELTEYLGYITSPNVYQYILDTYKPSLEQVITYFNPRFSVLIKDYIIKNESVIERSIIEKFDPNYYIMRDLYKHYQIQEYYDFNTDLPKALQEYNGKDEELLNILFTYNRYPLESYLSNKYFNKYGYNVYNKTSIRVDLSVKYFEKALELCSDHTALFKRYSDAILSKIRYHDYEYEYDYTLSYNFLKAFIQLYPGEFTAEITKIILNNKLQGLLELMNFDEKMLSDHIDKLMSEDDIAFLESEYVQYLNQLIPVAETD